MEKDKTLLLFGPGKHFGAALAKRFAREGFHLVLIGRNEKSLSSLSSELATDGFPSTTVVGDVAKSNELKQIFSEQVINLPPVHAAIYNVKASLSGNALDISVEDFKNSLVTNVVGAVSAVQTSLPYFIEGASIIFTGGGYKDSPDPNKTALSVSKAALHNLYLSLIEPLAQKGVVMKTVVIDGVVRAEGPIKPEDVATIFWEAHKQETSEPIYIR